MIMPNGSDVMPDGAVLQEDGVITAIGSYRGYIDPSGFDPHDRQSARF